MIPVETSKFIWYMFEESSETSLERILWESIKGFMDYGEPSIVTRQKGVTWFGWDHISTIVSVDDHQCIYHWQEEVVENREQI